MAVLKWGSTGPEVEVLQNRLRAAGFYFGPIDGSFGPLTYSAVRRFQQARGLLIDGIAGPQTMAALGVVVPSDGQPEPSTGGQALSLHIGINRVDPAAYGGWDGALSGCEADARTMREIAVAEGFTASLLFSAQATSATILQEIQSAARVLRAGDTYMLTYAGHGGQVADLSGDGVEEDRMDETWVAFDRQLLDDELEQAFRAFQPGTNIVVLSDSCHSGTVVRLSRPVGGGARDWDVRDEWELQRRFSEVKAAFYTDLIVPRPGPGALGIETLPRPRAIVAQPQVQVVGARARAAYGDSSTGTESPVALPDTSETTATGATYATRNMPLDVQAIANEIQRPRLRAAKLQTRAAQTPAATGVLLAGCMDSQLSQELNGAGVFTTAVRRVWADNAFSGSFTDFIAQVVSQMGPSQTPQLTTFGANADRLVQRTPFNVMGR